MCVGMNFEVLIKKPRVVKKDVLLWLACACTVHTAQGGGGGLVWCVFGADEFFSGVGGERVRVLRPMWPGSGGRQCTAVAVCIATCCRALCWQRYTLFMVITRYRLLFCLFCGKGILRARECEEACAAQPSL